MQYCNSSVVVGGIEDRLPPGDLGCAARRFSSVVTLVPAAPQMPHEGFSDVHGGVGHERVPLHTTPI